MFYIFYDPEYKEPDYSQPLFALIAKGQIIGFTGQQSNCLFDNNIVYHGQFYFATEYKNRICFQCAKEKDPQIINIMDFINNGNNLQAKINKLNIGMEQLRKMIAESDPYAKKCPLCKTKRAYSYIVQGQFGYSCNNCNIAYKGAGQFVFDNKVYNFEQAKKIYKMKAFK